MAKEMKGLRAREKELKNVIKEERKLGKVKAQIDEGLETGERAVIHVLTDQNSLYHPMSLAESPLLNTEIFNFVEEDAQFLTSFVPIRIVLLGFRKANAKRFPPCSSGTTG
ncbi:MAG: hypothetical protein K5746_05765 [Clostridiales bacterium]|nr:hypothetical protein [Clostridiales bacterium]